LVQNGQHQERSLSAGRRLREFLKYEHIPSVRMGRHVLQELAKLIHDDHDPGALASVLVQEHERFFEEPDDVDRRLGVFLRNDVLDSLDQLRGGVTELSG
jgi:hypothetical protein